MPLSRKPIPLRSFAPDLDPTTPGILTDGNDFYPTVMGVRTLPPLHKVTQALPGPCRGGCIVTFADGSQYVIAGTEAALNVLPVIALDSTAPPAWGTQDLGTGANRWRFAFYNDWVIAVDGVHAPKYATQASLNVPLAAWSDLPGNPPIASTIASSDFSLFLVGELPPASGEVLTNRWWSTVDPTIWTPSVATETVTAQLNQTTGPILGAKSLRSSMVLYKASSIFVGALSGPPLIWTFQEASRQVGAVSQEAIVATSDVHYFLGGDDWYTFDGFNVQRLRNEHREWFFARMGADQLRYVVGRFDSARSLIFWHYSTNPENPLLQDEWLCLNVRTGLWTKGSRLVEMSPASISPDTILSTEFGITNGLFLSDDCLYVYGPTGSGASAGSFVTTGAIGDRYNMYQLSRVRPGSVQLSGTPQLTTQSAYTPGAPFVDGVGADLTPDGWFNLLNTARLQQLKFSTDADWELADYTPQLNIVGDV